MERIFRPRFFFALLLGACVAILGTALASQYIGGLRPCTLCLWQRYPYAVVIGLSGIGFGMAAIPALAPTTRGLLSALIAALAAGVLFTNAGIAAFHVGVEQKWWEGLQSCSNPTSATTVEALGAQLLAAPVVRCDEVAWSLAGISMAGYNFIAATGLGMISAYGAWVMKGARHG